MDADKPTGHPPTTAEHRMSTTLRASWYYVLVAALTIGGWSVYHLLYARLHLPWLIAVGGALVFDGAGLIFSEYARAAIERGRGFLLPAVFMLGSVCTSSYVNYSHGVSLGWGTAGGAVLGAAPVLLELLFVAHVLDARMTALHRQRLLPERLPRIGVLGAVLFPRRSFRAIRAVIGRRLDIIEAGLPARIAVSITPAPVSAPDAKAVPPAVTPPADALDGPASVAPARAFYDDPRCHAIRAFYETGFRPTTKQMQRSVQDAGLGHLPESTARTLRTVIEAVEPGLADLPSVARTEPAA
ncbi:hypothetical protein ACIBSV_46895 [Embleya sp. NPDC050154]|uniref:hypothetical protein n=1 Tax=Embleya sp. NPDC050154 TaxID=3363988 RepID=UPI0037AA25C4